MRVLFWSSTFWPSSGGVQVLAARLLPALEARGYEHIVVTPQSRDAHLNVASYKGMPIRRLPFWPAMVNLDQLGHVRQPSLRGENPQDARAYRSPYSFQLTVQNFS
jgi:hypothetical protein